MINRLILPILVAIIVAAAFVGVFPESGVAQDVPRISAAQLNRMLGDENLVIVDARSGSDWRGSELKIKGAIRGKSGDEDDWASGIPRDAEIVVYCA